MESPGGEREILFESVQIGAIVKVSAVDARTGIEAVIQGPASAGEVVLQQAALRKLMFLLKKHAGS